MVTQHILWPCNQIMWFPCLKSAMFLIVLEMTAGTYQDLCNSSGLLLCLEGLGQLVIPISTQMSPQEGHSPPIHKCHFHDPYHFLCFNVYALTCLYLFKAHLWTGTQAPREQRPCPSCPWNCPTLKTVPGTQEALQTKAEHDSATCWPLVLHLPGWPFWLHKLPFFTNLSEKTQQSLLS